MTFLSRWYNYLYIYWHANCMKNTPIIVYQMGKVGSTSITYSLRKCGIHPVYHVHRMNPNNIENVSKEYLGKGVYPQDESLGAWLYENICQKNRKAKFITLAREPVSRNFAAFFQNFKRFTGTDHKDADFQIEKLVELFLSEYRHETPLNWFDIEMKKTIGIDVYKNPFPKEKGYITIKKENFDLLVLKLELLDNIKQKVLTEFLDIKDLELTRANVGENKNYSKTYYDFKRTIQLPDSYLERMLSSKYTKHFYSNTEIEAIWSKWADKKQRDPSA